MRPIKFRSWNRKWNLFGYVTLTQGAFDQRSVGNSEFLEPWQQFTGLLDKNGKEIYEGDVVHSVCHVIGDVDKDYGKRAVEWNADGLCFELTSPWNGKAWSSHFAMRKDAWDLTVIGNIHENPELLKDAEVMGRGEGLSD